MRLHTLVDSPIGDLTLVAEDDHLVGLYLTGQRHLPRIDAPRSDRLLPRVKEQLTAYFAGQLQEFDVPIRLQGTAFQLQVWRALQAIPYGQTWSYGRIAEQIGRPTASRAVGLANGRNPISLVVPCHRVVGSDGKLVGYGGGLERKELLLALERTHRAP